MKRGKFSLSHYKLFTGIMGNIIPCGLVEVLPGDTIQHAMSLLVRLSPLVTPVMHPVHVKVHHWFVPHRLVWDNWEDFITGGPDGMNSDTIPTITFAAGVPVGSLADYLGLPPGITNLEASALPFRGYNMIYNEYYRDQDLTTLASIDTGDGPDTTTSVSLRIAAWDKDYFTAARPWEQKGPAITVPIGTSAPVKGFMTTNNSVGIGGLVDVGGAPTNTNVSGSDPTQVFIGSRSAVGTAPATAFNATNSNIYADLSNASAVTINLLREAFALQRFEEARARYGSRYTEYLRYLGVRSSDARLQRPEYLGGGRNTIQFSEVVQTGEAGTDPVGSLKGHGIGAMRSNRYRRFFEEHGYVFSFFMMKPISMYVQGIPRTFNKRVKEDFWQRELQHIGQQEVLQKEVYFADDGTGNNTFGYQDRYDEYRRMFSNIAGEFRNNSMDEWHMARIFSSAPALNDTFVRSLPTNRIFASTATDQLQIMANHSIQARRLIAKMGTSFIY